MPSAALAHLTLCATDRFCERAAWSYEDARTEVQRISGLVSFEPDMLEVYLDDVRLRLAPGQSVIPHGVDRELTPAEVSPAEQR